MSFVFFLLWLFVGFTLSVFWFAQVIIIPLFALPFTHFLIGLSAIRNSVKIKVHCYLALAINAALIFIAVKLLDIYATRGAAVAVFVGAIISLFNLLRPSSWGMTPNNIRDYVELYKPHFVSQKFAESILSDELFEVWAEKRWVAEHPMMETLMTLHQKYTQTSKSDKDNENNRTNQEQINVKS